MAGFGTGVIVGIIVGGIIGYVLRKGVGAFAKGVGGEIGTYVKDPKTGKVTQQAFPAFSGYYY
jgi:hypothetical protein